MSRTPRPPNSTWPGPPAAAARQARGPELVHGDAHDEALAVEEVRDHVGREDRGHDDLEHDHQHRGHGALADEGADAETDQEPDADVELEPQPDLDHLVDRRVELTGLGGGVVTVDGGDVAVDHGPGAGGTRDRYGAGGRAELRASVDEGLVVLLWMLQDPALELRLAELGRDGDPVDANRGRLRGAREAGHQAHDGEGHGDQRQDDRQAGRDPGQVEREARAAGDHQVPEHPVGQVRRSRRGPEGRGDDEPELGHRLAQELEHRRTAGRPVALRVDHVEQQPDAQDEDRQAHGQQHGDHHEAAPFPQLKVLRGDQAPARDPRPVPAGDGGTIRPGTARRRDRGVHRRACGRGRRVLGHDCSPRRLVTDKNQSSRVA